MTGLADWLQGFIGPLWEIRSSDAIDILIVSILVYAAIVWIRRTQAALVAGGILLLAVLYAIASALDLQLTVWILQGFFAVFLIVIVIIFQEELRQLFERLALWSLRRRRPAAAPAQVSDMLVQVLTDLARDRIGALVVLPGGQPIDRHVRGGIELGAAPSVPLLESIFDPHSPGHDGAVLIENGRVARFAVQLPLSSDFVQLSGMGTRHSAALGLAERTDAVSLVVSEERGTISVARNGGIRAVKDSAELRSILGQSGPKPARARLRAMRGVLRENWFEKVATVAVVLLLWLLFVPGSRLVQRQVQVPVAVVGVPENTVVDSLNPKAVAVTFDGPARAFYFIEGRSLEATVDASKAKPGRTRLRIREENVRYPTELTLQSLSPPDVTLTLVKASQPKPPNAAKGS